MLPPLMELCAAPREGQEPKGTSVAGDAGGVRATLEGPEGTWTGHGYGFYDWEHVAHVMVMLTGSGAYEGLTYAVLGTVPSNSMTADFVGFIGPGASPPGFPVMPAS